MSYGVIYTVALASAELGSYGLSELKGPKSDDSAQPVHTYSLIRLFAGHSVCSQ